MSGTGWTCTNPTCTRTDGLQSGATYPYITLTVNVASNAPASVWSKATLTVGSGSPTTFTDTNSTQQKLAPPTFSPPAGAYNTTQNVTLQAAPGASIRYATSPDGVTWGAWQPYTLPIPVTTSMSIQAVASETGMADSAPAVAAYTLQFLLTTTVNPPGAGSITVTPSAAWYAPGTAVTLTATASSGYSFLMFTGDLNASANPQTVTMNGSKSIAANFVPTSVPTLAPNTAPGSNAYSSLQDQYAHFDLSFTRTDSKPILTAQTFIVASGPYPPAPNAGPPGLTDTTPFCWFGYYYFGQRAGLYVVTYSNNTATANGILWTNSDQALDLSRDPAHPDLAQLSGSYCTVKNFTYSSGTAVTVGVDVAFTATFGTDLKTIWKFTTDFAGDVDDWTPDGVWMAPGPPATPRATQGCSDPNNNIFLPATSMTYTSPNQVHADTTVYSSGPESWNSLNYASTIMLENGKDLGYHCPTQSSVAEITADGRVPCDSNGNPLVFNVNKANFYIAEGQTYVKNSLTSPTTTPTFNTYFSLGFAPTGGTADFTVPQDGLSDTVNATEPTINSTDGVLVSYPLNPVKTASSLPLHVVVPYAAQRGLHLVGFPANDSCGMTHANQNTWILVYDETPVITTVTPASISAGTQATLTIQGSWFGGPTNPTVFVGGNGCSGGQTFTPAVTHGSGTDSVTVAVTPPSGASSLSVCLKSNAAGGSTFLGAPLANQIGVATSNTASVQVAPPTITALTTPSGSFQIGTTGVPFEIDGLSLGAGSPTLNFSCGIINPTISSPGQLKVTGTFDIPAGVAAGPCTVTLTASDNPQSAQHTFNLVPGPPTISGNQGVWWLGSAAVNDNCAAGQACYYNSTQLTMAPGPGASPPSAAVPAAWSLTDPATGQAPTFASWACNANDATCSSGKVTATSQPAYCSTTGNVQVSVTLGGITSAPFIVIVDWPQASLLVGAADNGTQIPQSQLVGYISTNTLQLVSACKNSMFGIDWHEEFPTDASGNAAPFNACNASQGWTDNIPQAKWASGTTDDAGTLAPDFDVIVYTCGGATPCNPPATIPGPRALPPQPLNMTANAWSYQFIFVGSKDTQTLGKYWTTAPNKQVRYTDHGVDELGTWSCPGQ